MAKPHQEIDHDHDHDLDLDHPWSTWEELLLACAVNRHGTKSWDFVAMEVQSRVSSPLLLNAHNCRQKYHDLERRFMTVDPQSNGGEHTTTSHGEKAVLWVQQLTKLRVAELKRDVQRSDLSIVSLQQRVKKLKEEREHSSQEKENENEKSDLHKCSKKIEGGADEERDGESEKSSPVVDVGKRISGVESERGSNFSDPKCKNGEIGPEAVRKRDEAVETAAGDTDPVQGNPVGGEGSYDGSSETARAANGEAASIPVPEAGDSAEFPESVAESEGGGVERAEKESSDVQSSASLSRKRRRGKTAPGRSSGEEPDVDEVSPARKQLSVKSQRSDRLARLLEVIRSHKHGSVFERRLQSQESTNYRNLIRQHVDLEMIKTKLDEGLHSNSSLEFFRDLLLLFNNSIVFFPKNSTESLAAIELRDIISKKMITVTRSRSKPISNQKPHPPSKKPSPPTQPLPKLNPAQSPLRLPALEAKRNRPDVGKPGPDRDNPDAFMSFNRNMDARSILNERRDAPFAFDTNSERNGLEAIPLAGKSISWWLNELDVIAKEVEAELVSRDIGCYLAEVLEAVNVVLFQSRGFKRHPLLVDSKFSYLHTVLSSGNGSAIMLSVIYIEVCRRLGITIVGSRVGEEFLIWPQTGNLEELFKVSSGHSLFATVNGRCVEDPRSKAFDLDSESLLGLDIATNRDIIGITLANLIRLYWKRASRMNHGLMLTSPLRPVFGGDEKSSNMDGSKVPLLRPQDLRLAIMACERLLILQPHNWALRKDHGMLLFYSRRYGEAVQELSICMAFAPVEEAEVLEPFVEKLHLLRLESSWKSMEKTSRLAVP